MLGINQRYSLERVLRGVMAYFDHAEPRGRMYDKIREYASKKPRKIY